MNLQIIYGILNISDTRRISLPGNPTRRKNSGHDFLQKGENIVGKCTIAVLFVAVLLLFGNSSFGGSFSYANDCWIAMNQKRATANDKVNAILPCKGKLYVGGNFTEIGSTSVKYIAQWDGAVNALALSDDGNTLYVGGNFDNVGVTVSPMLAAVDLRKKTSVAASAVLAQRAPGYRLVKTHCVLTGLDARDIVSLHDLKGRRLFRQKGISTVDLGAFSLQPLVLSVSREKKTILSSVIMAR